MSKLSCNLGLQKRGNLGGLRKMVGGLFLGMFIRVGHTQVKNQNGQNLLCRKLFLCRIEF